MSFGPSALRGHLPSTPGEIDYRLARQSVISEYRKGRLAGSDVCDAHPELRRAAREVGKPTKRTCPICEEVEVVLVTYVFGTRMPAFGRCVTSAREMRTLSRKPGELVAYVVEVCNECHWNHLVRSFVLTPARPA